MDLTTEPDLHPLYPTTSNIDLLLSPNSGLDPTQKSQLVAHCLSRACNFGDLALLSHLVSDRQAQAYVDLSVQDEDGLGLVSMTIQGFGAESDRDIEREECVRLLIAQGAQLTPDKGGWTPLHHAALLSPPTLITHLMTHGCSPFDVSRRNLTPLDIVSGHSIIPGRDGIALLLEEAMRSEGWSGGRVEARRHQTEERARRKLKRKYVRDGIGKLLEVESRWLGQDSSDTESECGDDDDMDDTLYTPPLDFTSMLVFCPPCLPDLFDTLITSFPPLLRNAEPANLLYLLARFACLNCDHTWLEDLIVGAADAIEDNIFSRPDDLVRLVFWLYNTTTWLHLMRCDDSISEACELLGSFELLEEVINSIFVFVIRFVERKVDKLLDSTLLDHSPLASEFDSVQFESEWSFLRPFTSAKKKASPAQSHFNLNNAHVPSSPVLHTLPSSATKGSFSSIRQSITRGRASSSATTTPLQMLFPESPPSPSPMDLTSFLSAVHSLLTISHVNPALITQLWSQVMYWTSCEMFNRVLTRKKHICRSRAIQIGMNLCAVEEWIEQMGLPRGVGLHFAPVRDLLNWLQCLSSITDFPDLVATIQTMKHINPLQMRRAARDYRYEVNEGKMTDEYIQYLTQLQKDWERHRVKIGVEALKKEIGDRERERDESGSSSLYDGQNSVSGHASSTSISEYSQELEAAQQGIDMLFDRTQDQSIWEPVQPPQVLGELLDSRYMIPLVFPSDSRLLAARPGSILLIDNEARRNTPAGPSEAGSMQSQSRAASNGRGAMVWRSQNRQVRDIGAGSLKWVDGAVSASRWGRPWQELEEEEGEVKESIRDWVTLDDDANQAEEEGLHVNTRLQDAPLTRKPSTRNKGRQSHGGEIATPIE